MPYPYYNFYPQNQQNQFTQAQPQMQSPFVMVRSEAEARNYPVAFGNVVSFKDENAPYIYTKTMGFSQSDKPVFEKYRKDVEEVTEEKKEPQFDGLKEHIDSLESQIASMQKDIEFLKERKRGRDNEHNGNGKSV